MGYSTKLKATKTSEDHIYRISDPSRVNEYKTINIKEKTCSCKELEEYGIPCQHFFALPSFTSSDSNNLVDQLFHTETVKKAYSKGLKTCELEELNWDDSFDTPLTYGNNSEKTAKKRKPSVGESSMSMKKSRKKSNSSRLF